ncbi:EAL domain-containing protein [Citrobacter sp. Cpo074]|uniref:EAL domain-containing protein n=1 Tax=Citrobacter sp. Cpo074 TaxID=2985135 RepID=UPI002577A4A0|nr:EAL domain-containing protein [Citrobacter sp. Cpo074]MDM2849587.1 EAL domain-containing protein [Citrobacter sp. Cpo074]MDU3157714.1 EAL domain-containing protein [Hafnia alvei]
MNTKKIFLLSYDTFLFSGIKAWLPNLVLIDARTFISGTQSVMSQYPSCLLVIDNRLPLLLVKKWLQRNSTQFINIHCIVLRMCETLPVNRGYEDYSFINGGELSEQLIAQLKESLLAPNKIVEVNKDSPMFTFNLTEFEEEMLYSSFTKEKLHDFCIANSLTIKSVYRYRDKITARLGFSNFNETVIFLTRNNLLNEGSIINNNVSGDTVYTDAYDVSDTSRLSMAIRNEEIIPYFQPIVNIRGDVCGVEVLARWPQGHNYAISQREFIPLAEKSGLINELTSYLMTAVARNLVSGGASINKTLFVSFNVSPSGLNNPVFYWECLNFMEITQGLPIKLMIEITENQTFTITPAIKELIRSLRNKGVLFALDDFGTGYANLCYLNELDLDVIKIDKSFIKEIKEVDQYIPMLESITHLSGLLGLRTVAEGVENDYQQQWLGKNNVDYLQGYQFLPPVTFNDFIRYYQQSVDLFESASDSPLST